MIMRTTKVYSISMPMDLARQAEALAREESRTMSELFREALRRYQQSEDDLYELINRIAPTPPEMRAMQEEARRNGTDKLTMAEIQREVRAVRRLHNRKKRKLGAK